MKRTIVILLILILSVACMTTTTVLADTASSNVIYLLSPTAIECSGDKLLVADNITTNQSAVHIFSTTSAAAQYEKTIDYTNQIIAMRCYLGNAYIIFADSYAIYNIDEGTTTTVEESIQDIAVYRHNDRNYVYTLVNNEIYRDSSNKGWSADSLLLIDSTLYAHNKSLKNITPYILVQNDDINEGKDSENIYQYTDNQVINSFNCNGNRLFVTSEGITNGDDVAPIIDSINIDYACGDNNGNIYILNNKKVEQWNSTDKGYTKSEHFKIGSDKVELDTTTHDKFNSYTTVVTNGYPTNILYMTTGDNSISEALTLDNGEQYIILGYDEDINNGYHYVLYKNQFAWVKRSANTIAEETTLTLIDNNISGDINYNAKLTSANSVYIYSLPTDNAEPTYLRDTIKQSSTNLTEVKLLKSHISNNKTAWYYIEYMGEDEQLNYGWVNQGGVGNIVVTIAADSNILLDKDTPHLKVSASLSENVYIYATSNMLDTERLTNPNSNELMVLSDNTNVNVIKKTDSATYIQVVVDGTAYYGWVNNDYLITLGEVPMTLIIALSATMLAVVLILISIKIVKVYRKKSNKQVAEESNS